MAKATSRKTTPKKAPAAKRAPRPKAQQPKSPPEQPPAPASTAAVRQPEKGDKVTYRHKQGSLHDGVIREVHGDGSAHLALGDGTERKEAPMGTGEELQPGEWKLA